MTPLAHVAAGYLTTQIVDVINPSLQFNTVEMIIVGIVAGNLPDLDVLFVKDMTKHRNTITHAPLFWLVVVGVILIGSRLMNSELVFRYSLALGLGLFSHFFTDWFAARGLDGGIRLLYPFSKKHYGLFPLKKDKIKFEGIQTMFKWEFIEYYTENSFLFWSEAVLILAGLFVFLSRSLSIFLGIFL
jgi:hypothetical protein